MDATRIGIVYTGSGCSLEKPRVLLGGVILRWLHWRDGRSFPCLRDYGVECKPCGQQTEYAFLSAAMVEEGKSPEAAADDRRERWAALSEEQREEQRAITRRIRPACRTYGLDYLDHFCITDKYGPATFKAPPVVHLATRPIVQCVPGLAMADLENRMDDLRGLVIRFGNIKGRLIRITKLPITLDVVPDDFDPQLAFDQRYGLHRLRRPVEKTERDERPATIPFRKAE